MSSEIGFGEECKSHGKPSAYKLCVYTSVGEPSASEWCVSPLVSGIRVVCVSPLVSQSASKLFVYKSVGGHRHPSCVCACVRVCKSVGEPVGIQVVYHCV